MQVVVSGVEHALKTIERYTDIQNKLMEIAYRLCEIGSTVCDSVYHTSVSVENGVHRHFRYSEMLDYIHNNVLPFVRVGAVS